VHTPQDEFVTIVARKQRGWSNALIRRPLGAPRPSFDGFLKGDKRMTAIKSRRRVNNENYFSDSRFAAETDKLLDDVCARLDYQGWTSAVLVYEKGGWSIIRYFDNDKKRSRMVCQPFGETDASFFEACKRIQRNGTKLDKDNRIRYSFRISDDGEWEVSYRFEAIQHGEWKSV
jgi:hypothetical protein